MPFSSHRLTKTQLFAVCFITTIAVVGLALGLSNRDADAIASHTRSQPASANAIPPAQTSKTPTQIDYALITLTPSGFYPKEITRPKGQFLLAVDNRVGNKDVALRLVRDNGAKEREKNLVKGQLRWRQLVNLNPGRYVLTEANRPDWVCNITIVAR